MSIDNEKREVAKRTLQNLERLMIQVFTERPDLRNIGRKGPKNCVNELIRYIWDNYGDENASSIIRIAAKIRAEMPEYDTGHNQKHRANAEVAVREHLKQSHFNLKL